MCPTQQSIPYGRQQAQQHGGLGLGGGVRCMQQVEEMSHLRRSGVLWASVEESSIVYASAYCLAAPDQHWPIVHEAESKHIIQAFCYAGL